MRTTGWLSLRPARRFALAIVLCVLVVLLASCDPAATQAPSPTPTATATATATPSPTVTPAALPGPQAASSPLGPPPPHCPAASSKNQTMTFPSGFGTFGGRVEFIGQDIIWLPSTYYPTTLHLGAHGADSWPDARFIWEVGPNALETVSVRVTDLQTNTALWWIRDIPPTLATQTLVLDPSIPGPAEYHGQPRTNWREWAATLLIPQSGCYALDAKWAGGVWHVIFAAGR
ncbi:MAG TPA: hypothetical protein VFU88_22405 [Ktedonobacterales bacterium]|nr:hypothetical protein [Ktedonobacterales bacterium]